MWEHLWAVVLAGGDGARIRHLTKNPAGRSVPKQYASIDGQASLLRRTLERAEHIVPRERVAVVVARQHREHWEPELSDRPPWNVIVQPQNRGTGTGVLLALLHLCRRDPRCALLLLPSDHHVDDEGALSDSLVEAARHALERGRPTLVGMEPDGDGRELGWIVAEEGVPRSARHVVRFVEKPDPGVATGLASEGALVNSMILASRADVLTCLFREFSPRTFELLESRLAAAEVSGTELETLYEALPRCDLSRDVLEKAARRLAVWATAPCGWTDIGTPARLNRILGRDPAPTPRVA
jgi:mannose-1-phosphate guanylyltransferase